MAFQRRVPESAMMVVRERVLLAERMRRKGERRRPASTFLAL